MPSQHRPGNAVFAGGANEPIQFVHGFPFDAHGQAERANFQISDLTGKDLVQQVVRLICSQRASPVFASTDFFDVASDAHEECQGGDGGNYRGRITLAWFR